MSHGRTPMIFATPDFGAGAAIMGFLACVWLFVLGFSLAGLVWGWKLCLSDKPRAKRCGVVVLLFSGMVPLSCCLLPSQLFRMSYGSYPLRDSPYSKVYEGMTRDEVVSVLGDPHNRRDDEDGGGRWVYYRDAYELNYFTVYFGPDGRVKNSGGN
jgi:SmpA / OmlA family